MIKSVEVKLVPNQTVANNFPDSRSDLTFGPSNVTVTDNTVFIDGIGEMPFRGPRIVPNSFEQATLKDHGGRWMLTFHVPARVRALPETGAAVGVDLGVRWLVFTSDNKRLAPNDDLVRLDKLNQKRVRQLATKARDSSRYRELKRQINGTTKHIFEIQRDQADKIAAKLVQNYDTICVEEINPKGKTIQHAPDYRQAAERCNWPLITESIQLRAFETGREVVLVPPWFTSQLCGRCGWYAPKPLDNRTHHCKQCGFHAERDLNASIAIRERGLAIKNGSRRTDWRPIGHPQYVPNQD